MSFSNSHILIVWYLSGLLLSNLGAFDFDITQATLTEPTYMANFGAWVSPNANVMSVSNDQRTTNFIRPSFRGFDKLPSADAVEPDRTPHGSEQIGVPRHHESIAVVHKEEHMPATDPLTPVLPATPAITTLSESEPLKSQPVSQSLSEGAPAIQPSAVAQPEPKPP